MSKTKKFLLLIGFMTVVALVIGYALLWFLIPSDDFVKKNVETALASAIKTPISIGDISVGFSLPGPVKVFARDIRILGNNKAETLFIKSLQMTPSLLGLLKGNISISSIQMDGISARIIIHPDGIVEYPFFPPPVSSNSADPSVLSKGPAVTTSAAEQMSKPEIEVSQEPGISWSIDEVRATDIAVGLTDLRDASSDFAKGSLAVSGIEMAQTSRKNEFTVVMNGVKFDSGPESTIKSNVKGVVKLKSSLASVETLQLNLKIETANLSALTPFAPEHKHTLERFSIQDGILKLDYDASQGTVAELSAPLSHAAGKSSPIMLRGRVETSKDSSSLSRLELNGESSGTPLALFAPFNTIHSIDLSKGVFSGSFAFNGNPLGEWSGKADLKLQGASLIKGSSIGLSDAGLSVVASGTPRVISLQEFNVKDQSILFKLSGEITDPLRSHGEMAVRLDTELQTEGKILSALTGTEEISLKGPLTATARIRGPLGRIVFDIQADLTKASIEAAGRITKHPETKGAIAIKGTLSNLSGNKRKAPSVDGTLGFEFSKTSLNSTDGKPAIRDLDLYGKSTFDYAPKGMDLKDLEVEIRRHSNKTFLAKFRGNIEGLLNGAMKINATVNSNLDNDFISGLGMADPKGFRFLGHTTLGVKIAQNAGAYSFAVDAPLKGLEISFGDLFAKKQGVDGSLSLNGVHSRKLTKLNAVSLALPGVSLGATGKIADPRQDLTEFDLLIKEVDFKKLSSMLPNFPSNSLSGRCSGKISLKSDKNAFLPHGSIHFDSILFKPQKSMIYFDQMNGLAVINGMNLDKVNFEGKARGFVEAPISASGKLQNMDSMDHLKGNVSVRVGRGAIKFQNFKGVLSKPQTVLGAIGALGASLLNNESLASPEFESITGDFSIEKGIAHTDNLRQVGGDIRSGVIGDIDLRNHNLNAMMAAKALVYPPEQLGKIPAVKELAKKHEGLLKIMGLDKELKKIGIDTEEQKSQAPDSGKPTKTPIFMIFKLSGNAGEPSVTPVLEKSISEAIALKLKALVD